jgi:hypothetical protein
VLDYSPAGPTLYTSTESTVQGEGVGLDTAEGSDWVDTGFEDQKDGSENIDVVACQEDGEANGAHDELIDATLEQEFTSSNQLNFAPPHQASHTPISSKIPKPLERRRSNHSLNPSRKELDHARIQELERMQALKKRNHSQNKTIFQAIRRKKRSRKSQV